jgi:hypothetical protein
VKPTHGEAKKMQYNNRRLAAALALAGGLLAACGNPQTEPVASTQEEPATVEAVPGTDLHQVTLTEQAARRIGLATAPARVAATGEKAGREVVPTAAVIYAEDGSTWTFTSPRLLVFVRQRVTVGRIDGDFAVLRSGPPPGTPVVTVGAAELLGAEYGVEGE